MMNGIAGIATAGASSAAAEAAGGNMNFGSVRANAVNMNKYDATHAVSAGYSSKLSMDTQQTASNQSSARTGTEVSHHDKNQIQHDGSTHVYGPNGEHYEVNGTTTVTAGGMQASGMIQQYNKNGNVTKQWNGDISASGRDMGAFKQNTINGNEASYQATEIITKNLSNNENVNERNTYQAGKQEVNNIEINERDSSKYGKEYINNTVNDTRDIIASGSEITEGNKFTSDNSTNINAGIRVNESNTFTSGDKITNYGNTVEYTNPYNSLMTGGHDKIMGGFYKDYAAIQNGSSSKSMEQLESEIFNYTKQLSADMPASLSATYQFNKNSSGGESHSSYDSTSYSVSGGLNTPGTINIGEGGKGKSFNMPLNGSASVGIRGQVSDSYSYETAANETKGGSSSQDMMAKHLQMKVMQDMKSLHNMNALANDETGKFLAGNLGNYVEDKINKPL